MSAAIEVDWAAIAAVLAAGEAFGDDAPTSLSRIPDFGFDPLDCLPRELFKGTTQDARVECDTLVRTSLRQVAREASGSVDVALGLSGGRDSRHLALAARAEGLLVTRYLCARHWVPAPSDADVAAARQLADRLDVQLEVIEQDHDRYAAEWRKNHVTGLQTLNHSWALPLGNALESPGVLLDGLNGGGLFGRDPLTASWIRRHGSRRPNADEAREHALQHVIAHGRRRVRQWLDSPRIPGKVWKEVERRFALRLEHYLGLPNPFQGWWVLERARRGTSLLPFVIVASRRTIAPYFTPDMLRLALSLPWEISSQPAFQEEMLAESYPDVADVPYAHALVAPLSRQASTTFRAQLDTGSEQRSWNVVRTALSGHVKPSFLAARESPSDSGRGNRRMVLLAQALEWESGEQRPDP